MHYFHVDRFGADVCVHSADVRVHGADVCVHGADVCVCTVLMCVCTVLMCVSTFSVRIFPHHVSNVEGIYWIGRLVEEPVSTLLDSDDCTHAIG